MKMILILILIIPGMALASLVEPVVTNTSQAHEVVLGADVKKALEKFDSKFKLLQPRHYLDVVIGNFENYPNELPQAVSADFNGDGFKDILVMGMSEVQKSIVIKAVLLVSAKDKYIAIPLDQWNAELPRGTNLNSADERIHNLEMYLGIPEAPEIENTNIPRDRKGFKIEVHQKATTLYFFKDGTIHKALRRYKNQ